jgi:cold shock CspA family protein
MQGTMLWFNDVKDLGVVTAEGGERLSVHGTGFLEGERPKGRCAGAGVTFGITEEDGERRAVGVSFVPEVAPRRARMRHARYRSH